MITRHEGKQEKDSKYFGLYHYVMINLVIIATCILIAR